MLCFFGKAFLAKMTRAYLSGFQLPLDKAWMCILISNTQKNAKLGQHAGGQIQSSPSSNSQYFKRSVKDR